MSETGSQGAGPAGVTLVGLSHVPGVYVEAIPRSGEFVQIRIQQIAGRERWRKQSHQPPSAYRPVRGRTALDRPAATSLVPAHESTRASRRRRTESGAHRPRACPIRPRCRRPIAYPARTWVESLGEALRWMTLAPAQRLEHRVPGMRNKGRLREGADADVVVFDPLAVSDQATYERPAQYSAGIRDVLVNGAFVVRDGRPVPTALPGRPVRAPIQ